MYAIRRLEGSGPRELELVHQPPLEGPIHPLASTPRLGRVGGDVLHPEPLQDLAHLRRWVLETAAPAVGVSKAQPARSV